MSVLVHDGVIEWIRPADSEEDPGDAEVIDAGGATIVPGMVDCHSHLTLPGGSHWIARGNDTPEQLLRYAEHSAKLQTNSGGPSARDVGAPVREDPFDGRKRALSLGLRDRWHGHADYPYVRAAGSWVTRTGSIPLGLAVEAENADELLRLTLEQLDDGADFVKLYLDGPDPNTAPWSADEVRRVVAAAHERGAKVTAHAGRLSGSRICAEAGADCIEHGFELHEDCVRLMAERGITLVSTLSALKSWTTFGQTTTIERFASPEGRKRVADRWEAARSSVKLAHGAGVVLGGGTDFGGGSGPADQLAWEGEALTESSLEPWEALAAVTWKAGEILDQPEAGQIREGGRPDLFLVHGDPLSDPSALLRVCRLAWARETAQSRAARTLG